nr:MAG TPA: hypothetical protein [Caudoviricetes sp.]
MLIPIFLVGVSYLYLARFNSASLETARWSCLSSVGLITIRYARSIANGYLSVPICTR